MFSKAESKELKQRFWKSFANYTRYYSKKIGEPISWMLYDTGVKGVEMKFGFEKSSYSVVLEVNEVNDDKRFEIFLILNKYKNILNEGFGDEIIWADDIQLAEKKFVSQIYVCMEGLKYHNSDNWPEIFQFYADNMYKLQRNFIEIQDILQEEIKSL